METTHYSQAANVHKLTSSKLKLAWCNVQMVTRACFQINGETRTEPSTHQDNHTELIPFVHTTKHLKNESVKLKYIICYRTREEITFDECVPLLAQQSVHDK